MGVLNNASINVYSESEYFTVAIFTGCAFTNCGKHTYRLNNILTKNYKIIKSFKYSVYKTL